MKNKIFSKYEFSKRYSLRKLSIGIFSIAVGLFSIGAVDGVQFIINPDYGVVHAACNDNGPSYFLNHYDEYETVYEADETLAKGEHKVARETTEGRQFLIEKKGCSNNEPFTALGDDELYHKPYEVIANKTNIAKEYYLKYLENLKKGVAETEEDKNEEARLLDKYINSPGEFFFETRTRKKVLLNKDENTTKPIHNEDGSVTIPSHSVSKKYKNYEDLFHEYYLHEIDENYVNAGDPYNYNSVSKEKYNKYVKDSFKLVKVGNVERIPISTTTIETNYVENNNLDYGVRNTTNQGREGLRENVVTYEVDRNTGDLKNPTTVENTIPMEKKIVEVGTKEKVVYSKKGNDVIKTTTTYGLNTTTGEVTPHDNEEVIKVGEVKDKVEYLKVGNDIVKRTTTHAVNSDNGDITSKVTDETIKVGALEDKVETEIINRTTKYKPDETLDYGKTETEDIGSDGSKTIVITYRVNSENGEVIESRSEPTIKQSKNKIIRVGTKPTIVIIERDNKQIKQITTYELNEDTGELKSNTKEEVIGDIKPITSKGEEKPLTQEIPEYTNPISTNSPIDDNGNLILPPVLDKPEFNRGVNSIEPPVEENLEYTGTLLTNTPIDENGNSILPPIVEKPEFNGGVNPADSLVVENPEYTGPLSTNTPVDDNGNLILPPVLDKPEFNRGVNSIEPPVEEKPEYKESVSINTPVDENGNQILPPVVDELPEFNGGVNPVNAPVTEKPEYNESANSLNVSNDNVNPINEIPEYAESLNDSTRNNQTLNNTENPKNEIKKERELPNTNSTSILTTLVSSIIGTLGLGYKSKRRK